MTTSDSIANEKMSVPEDLSTAVAGEDMLEIPAWCAPVTTELKRIKGRHAQKKRATILKLVEAELFSSKMDWGDTAVCSHSIWYGKWQHDPLVQDVRGKVYDIIAEQQITEAATAVHRAAMILKMGTPEAAQKLVDLVHHGETDTVKRMAARDVLNMASSETAEKGQGLNVNADQLAILIQEADREIEDWEAAQPPVDLSQVTNRLPDAGDKEA